MHNDGTPADSAHKPLSGTRGNARRSGGSSFARAARTSELSPDISASPVAKGAEPAGLQFPMSPAVPMIGYNAMRRQSSKRSRS